MADNTDQDKTEKPTPHKQRESRRKGIVLKSTDVMSLAIMLGASFIAAIYFTSIANSILLGSYRLFNNIGQENVNILIVAERYLSSVFFQLLPVAGVLLIFVIGTAIMQTGLVISAEPLKPDLQRLNPIEGMKKLFTIRTVFELVKVLIKVGLFTILICIIFWHLLQDVTSRGAVSLAGLRPIVHWYGVRLWVGLIVLMAIFAALDYFLSGRLYNKQMRMSRREVKEEYKRQEGDPMIRRRLRELRRELTSKAKSISAVKDADFLLVNPTHLCLAIRYRPHIIDAPVVVAKGAGHQAKLIKEIAIKHQVPILHQRQLARKMFFKSKIGQPVDPQYFADIARIMHRAGLLRKNKNMDRK